MMKQDRQIAKKFELDVTFVTYLRLKNATVA